MNKFFLVFKNPLTYLLVIILIGFIVRLYKIDNPVADWHSWRQADTAAVSRNFFKEGYNPFIPIGDDMSGIAEFPIANLHRYRFVEFPIYGSLVYFSYLINGGVDERLARLVSIIFSLGSISLIYLLASRYLGKFTGLVSALLFAILPYSIYYSRVILPEPSLIFFCLGMLYFLDRWIFENKLQQLGLGLIFMICAFLTKPMAIFYLLPLVYSYWQKEDKLWPIPRRYFLLLLGFLPLLGWRMWMSQHPEGIPASKWLLNGNGIRFRPAFWKWIIGDRFGRELLAVPGSVLFFVGLLIKPKLKEGYLLHLLALSSFLYLIIFATGNVQHDYYQTLIVPGLVIFTARGFVELLRGVNNLIPRMWTIPLALLFLPLTIYFTWGEIKGLYQINNPAIVEAGKEADAILPKDAKVVAPYQGDTAFLYQTNRAGLPIALYPVKDMIDTYGTHYYISTAKDARTKWLMRKYTTLIDTKDYVIIDLTHEAAGFDRLNDPEPQ